MEYQTKRHALDGDTIEGMDEMSSQGWRVVGFIQPHKWAMQSSPGTVLIAWERGEVQNEKMDNVLSKLDDILQALADIDLSINTEGGIL